MYNIHIWSKNISIAGTESGVGEKRQPRQNMLISKAENIRILRHTKPRKESAMNIIWFLLIGGVAGWLAGLIMKGKGFGILANIIVGIIGGIIGGWVFGVLGIGGESLIWSLITALVGAIILLFIVSLFKKKGVAE